MRECKVLNLSFAHIEKGDADLLSAKTHDNPVGVPLHCPEANDYGVFVWADETLFDVASPVMSFTFLSCISAAIDRGCDWIRFTEGEPVVDSLPVVRTL